MNRKRVRLSIDGVTDSVTATTWRRRIPRAGHKRGGRTGVAGKPSSTRAGTGGSPFWETWVWRRSAGLIGMLLIQAAAIEAATFKPFRGSLETGQRSPYFWFTARNVFAPVFLKKS